MTNGEQKALKRRMAAGTLAGLLAATLLGIASISPSAQSAAAQEDGPLLSDGWQSVFIHTGRPGQPMLHIFSQFPISAGHADFELLPPEQFTARVELCQAEKFEFSVDGNSNQTRIVLCSKDNRTAAERAQGLQRARDHLANESHMRAEYRDYILALLNEQIVKLGTQ